MASSQIDGNIQAIFAGAWSSTLLPSPPSPLRADLHLSGVRVDDIILSVTKPTLTAGLGIVNAGYPLRTRWR